jgi:phage terminase large subunit-like protein
VRRDLIEGAAGLSEEQQRRVLLALPEQALRTLAEDWPTWAHDGQEAPEGDWSTWVMKAGRGFGKTRAGAEWVSAFARANPGAAIAWSRRRRRRRAR